MSVKCLCSNLLGIMFYAIGRELFSSQSPSGVYSRAFKLCKKHEKVCYRFLCHNPLAVTVVSDYCFGSTLFLAHCIIIHSQLSAVFGQWYECLWHCAFDTRLYLFVVCNICNQMMHLAGKLSEQGNGLPDSYLVLPSLTPHTTPHSPE